MDFLGGKELKIKHPKAPFLSCLVFPSFYSFPRHFLKILRTKSSIGQFVETNTVNTYMFANIFLFQFWNSHDFTIYLPSNNPRGLCQVLDIDDDAEFLTQPVSESRAQEIMKAVMTVGSEGYHKVASEMLYIYILYRHIICI